jgi:hypothetical protein
MKEALPAGRPQEAGPPLAGRSAPWFASGASLPPVGGLRAGGVCPPLLGRPPRPAGLHRLPSPTLISRPPRPGQIRKLAGPAPNFAYVLPSLIERTQEAGKKKGGFVSGRSRVGRPPRPPPAGASMPLSKSPPAGFFCAFVRVPAAPPRQTAAGGGGLTSLAFLHLWPFASVRAGAAWPPSPRAGAAARRVCFFQKVLAGCRRGPASWSSCPGPWPACSVFLPWDDPLPESYASPTGADHLSGPGAPNSTRSDVARS